MSSEVTVDDEGYIYKGFVMVRTSRSRVCVHVNQPSLLSRSVSKQFGNAYFENGAPKWVVKITVSEFNGPDTSAVSKLYIESVGWPFPAMWNGWRGKRMGNVNELFAGIPTSWELPGRSMSDDHRVVFPVRFIWPLILVNVLFYSVIWFGLFLSLGTTRRAIRRKRGRCPKCAYNLRADFESGCSECGWNRGSAK